MVLGSLAWRLARYCARVLIMALLISPFLASGVYAAEQLAPDQFGKVPVGSASQPVQDCFCINGIPQGQTVTVNSVTLQGADPTDFATTSDDCVGFVFNTPETNCGCNTQSCNIFHTFDPQVPGPLTALVQVNTTDGTVQWYLEGTGGIIVSPTADEQFPIASPTSDEDSGSAAVTFTASGVTGTVTWTAELQYQPSKVREVPSPAPLMFNTTMPNQSVVQTYSGEGGLLSVSATAQGYTDKATAYITGSQITAAYITQATANAYCPNTGTNPCCSEGTCTTENGGQPATPDLLTMIANDESNCQQFVLNADTRYPSAYWPYENMVGPHPRGTYIGLMQAQISNPFDEEMDTAWDWLTNVGVGLDFFDQKIGYAISVQTSAIASHTGLAPLTQLQLENMGLGEYGTTAGTTASKQYYLPKCVGGKKNGKACNGGQWEWQVNKANAATKYVNLVRGKSTSCP